MRVAIATVRVPFVTGGAEMHAEGLRSALEAAGHDAEIFAIPFKWYPPEKILDHILACRLLDLTESEATPIDRLICLKFPAYFIPHPSKTLWILHQHRQAYDLWNHPLGDMVHYPNGAQVRDAIQQADRNLIPQARAVFCNSGNVAARLKRYCGIDAAPLYHPPRHDTEFYCAEAQPYYFFPSRLWPTKRQDLVLEALSRTRQPVRVRFAGTANTPGYAQQLVAMAARVGVEDRVEWAGQVPEEEKRRMYAEALGVVYPPVDEDYGYVTLEAMLAHKPVITCTDSGGPLEFVRPGETGLVAEPTAEALATAMDTLWADFGRGKAWGDKGFERYQELGINWPNVVQKLLQ